MLPISNQIEGFLNNNPAVADIQLKQKLFSEDER